MSSAPAQFLNVDLDLKSRTDPTALVEEWEGLLIVQRVKQSTRGHWVRFHLPFPPRDPGDAVRAFAKLTRRLPSPAERIWSRASKELDIGFQAGAQRRERGSAEWVLNARVVKALAELGVNVRITIYSPVLATKRVARKRVRRP